MKIYRPLVLDFSKKNYNTTIVASQFDTLSRYVDITLIDNSVPVDITNHTVRIYAKKPDGTKVFNDVEIIDATNGKVRVELTNQILAVMGLVECELTLYGTDESIIASQKFYINVDKTLRDDSAIESTNEFSALTNALNDIEQAKADIGVVGSLNTELENNINTGTQLKTDLDVNIQTGTQLKADLETDITTATQKKTELENVIATADTTTYATRGEIDEVNTALVDITNYIGYTSSDIYGVEVDFVNKTFTRLAGAINKLPGTDFNGINAFGGRKRCSLTDDGKVLAYYGEPGYSETGATTVEITKNSVTYPVGTKVQCMVEQPKFYYKVVPIKLSPIIDGIGYHLRKARYYVSDYPKPGFKIHPAFVRNGVEKSKIYLPAYEASIFDVSANAYLLADEQVADFTVGTGDKLCSIANAKPASGLTQNLTRANMRKLANNRGAGWQQKDVLCVSATQMLFMIEYAALNMQTAIGAGVTNKVDDTLSNMAELTGATTNLGNASGAVTNINGWTVISYRGEENFFGNTWKWVDGLNIECNNLHYAWYADNSFADDIKTSPYKNAGFTLAKANGYVSAFGYSEDCDFLFLPSEVIGASNLPVGDYFYQNHNYNGFLVARLGGGWADGSNAGTFCWYVAYASSYRYRNIGGRLLYVPQ